jgi:hypothetical protein
LVVEVGAWFGKTTLWLLQEYPACHVIAIDHWYWCHPEVTLPDTVAPGRNLSEVYRKNLWEYRDRVTVVQADTLAGLASLKSHVIKPDIIYLDADHGYARVRTEMLTCLSAFPDSLLCGDDWEKDNGVGMAVKMVTSECGKGYSTYGRFWLLEENGG